MFSYSFLISIIIGFGCLLITFFRMKSFTEGFVLIFFINRLPRILPVALQFGLVGIEHLFTYLAIVETEQLA